MIVEKEFLNVIIDISKNLKNIYHSNIDNIINSSIEKIVKSTNASRCFIYNLSSNFDYAKLEYICLKSDKTKLSEPKKSIIKNFIELLNKNRLLYYNDSNLNKLNINEFIYLYNNKDFKTILFVPIFSNNRLIGLFGIDFEESLNFNETILSYFKLLTEIISNALEHKFVSSVISDVYTQINDTKDDLSMILDQLKVGMFLLDKENRVQLINKFARDIFNISEFDVYLSNWRDILNLEDIAVTKIQSLLDENKNGKLSTLYKKDNNEKISLELEVINNSEIKERKIILLYDITKVYDLTNILSEKNIFYNIVGISDEIKDIISQIQMVSTIDSIVLVQGETGTGKEVIARTIHYTSERKKKPFIAVNCAGISDSLLFSQLFGHKKGAFTGAYSDEQGLFESASGGTIFLDEIGDTSDNFQLSLLRVLENNEIMRIGEAKVRKINTRVICATNKNLKRLVKEKKFRKDLYFRINIYNILIPPLRERKDDIPILSYHFLNILSSKLKKKIDKIDPNVIDLFLKKKWAGNIRELKNVIEHTIIKCKSDSIKLIDLPHSFSKNRFKRTNSEKDKVIRALERTEWNKKKAAELLGITRPTLYSKIKKYKIEIKEEN